jgi:hypothetical protein
MNLNHTIFCSDSNFQLQHCVSRFKSALSKLFSPVRFSDLNYVQIDTLTRLGFYLAHIVSYLPTFQDELSVPF